MTLNEQLINDCLLSLLWGKDNETWTSARKVGLSNEDLKSLIGERWSSQPGASHPIFHSAKGGKNPRFYLGTTSPQSDTKPTLAGAALLKRVRALLEIPLPAEADPVEVSSWTVKPMPPLPLPAAEPEPAEGQGPAPDPESPQGAQYPQEDSTYELVPLHLIYPNPYQPRQEMDPESIESLARGIKLKRETLPDSRGLMQVPIARQMPDGSYQLAFGHRRKEAFQHLYDTGKSREDHIAWNRMPLRVVELSDEQMYDYAARENGDREDLNPIEKAISIQVAMEKFGWELKRAAAAHGLAKSTGGNLTRLLALPEEVQALVIKGPDNEGIGQRHAKELVRLVQAEPPMIEKCLELARDCAAHSPTADQVASRVTSLIEEQRVRLQTEAKVKEAACYECDGPLQLQDTFIRCPKCPRAWTSLSEFERQQRLAIRTENRYCRTCGEPREFTGLELDGPTGKKFYCVACGDETNAGRWRRTPLPELPTGPVIIKNSTRMYGYWSCGVCGESQEPGRRTWITISGVESNCCDDCLKRLEPLVVKGETPEQPEKREPVYRPLFPNGVPQEGAGPKCARCSSATSMGFQATRPDKGWTQVTEGDQVKHYCTDCAWRHYEDLPCPGCGGKVYYAKMLQGLACEGCSRRWDFTANFRADVAKKAEKPAKIKGDKWSSVTYQGEWTCELCNQKQDRNRTKIIALLEGEEGPRQVCHPCSLDRLILDYPTCYVCKKGVVCRDRGYIRCTDCGNQWGSMAKFYTARVVEEPQIEEVKPAATGEFDCPRCKKERIVKINGVAACLGCGVRWMNPDDFHKERLIPSQSRNELPKMACPKCQGFHLKHTGNFHHCFTCKHEWNTPGFGSEQRRAALHKRAEKLATIINQCAIDALYQLESWFDQVEAAFPPVKQGSVSPGNTPEPEPVEPTPTAP